MKQQLNHSRRITYYSDDQSEADIEKERSRPTAAQKKFFKQLAMQCIEHGLNPATGFPLVSRMEYADGIDLLIDRLKDAGVWKGREKPKFGRNIYIDDDRDIVVVRERLVDSTAKIASRRKAAVAYGDMAAQRYKSKCMK